MTEPLPTDRDLRLARILDEAKAERRITGAIDVARWQDRYPDLAAELPALLATIAALDTAADDWRGGPSATQAARPAAAGKPLAPNDPARVGRYHLLGRLGRGGMGTVYLAQDPELERLVALKLPRFDGDPAEVEARRQRFLREAKAAAQVRHANVCPIFDVGEHDGQPFVVMAYVAGNTLADRGPREALAADPRRAVALVRELLTGLEAVHAAGIVHRDLKPGNILLERPAQNPTPPAPLPEAERGEPEGAKPPVASWLGASSPLSASGRGAGGVGFHPLITDFGLAQVGAADSERLTADGAVLGTPLYMAPEQAEGDLERIGPWSDTYSVGVLLYELLTGRPPFTGPVLEVMHQLLNAPVPPPSQFRPDLDRGLEALILRAMARRPEGRFPTAAALRDALGAWLDTGTAPDAAPPRRRRWWPAVAVAAGLAVALGLALSQVIVRVFDREGKEVGRQEVPPGGTVRVEPDPGAVPAAPRQPAGAAWPLEPLLAARPWELAAVLADLPRNDATLKQRLAAALHPPAGEDAGRSPWEGAQRRANAAAALAHLGEAAGLIPLLERGVADPLLRALLLDRLGAVPALPPPLAARFAAETAGELAFDGQGAHVRTDWRLNPRLPVTLEATVTLDPAARGPYSNVLSDMNAGGFGLGRGQGSWAICAFDAGVRDYRYAFATDPTAPGRRYHLAATFDPATREMVLFVDGKRQKQTVQLKGPLKPGGIPLAVGADLDAHGKHGRHFHGRIKDVRVTEEVLYRDDFVPPARARVGPKTVLLYHFDEGTGPFAFDATGRGKPGLIRGAAWVGPLPGRAPAAGP